MRQQSPTSQISQNNVLAESGAKQTLSHKNVSNSGRNSANDQKNVRHNVSNNYQKNNGVTHGSATINYLQSQNFRISPPYDIPVWNGSLYGEKTKAKVQEQVLSIVVQEASVTSSAKKKAQQFLHRVDQIDNNLFGAYWAKLKAPATVVASGRPPANLKGLVIGGGSASHNSNQNQTLHRSQSNQSTLMMSQAKQIYQPQQNNQTMQKQREQSKLNAVHYSTTNNSSGNNSGAPSSAKVIDFSGFPNQGVFQPESHYTRGGAASGPPIKNPNLMILGQSPSNQRLMTQKDQKLQNTYWRVNNNPSLNNHNSNHQGKDVISIKGVGNKTNVLPQYEGSQDYYNKAHQIQQLQHQQYAMSKHFALQNNALHVQNFANASPRGDSMIDQDGNHINHHNMLMIDDDGGIDERYDGYGEDSADELDEMAYDDLTSPKAPKPRPLDQTFMPQKGKKYFSITIGYPAMRRALRARGWIEVKCYKKLHSLAGMIGSGSPDMKIQLNMGLASSMNRQFDGNIDLKFVLSAQDANHNNLKNSCLMNQNRGEGNLTCKSGLSEGLMRSYHTYACWYPMEHCDPQGFGPESFFPRSHVINSPDALQEFQRDYILTEAENYLRKFVIKLQSFKENGPGYNKRQSRMQHKIINAKKRSPSKKLSQSLKKKSQSQLSSIEGSPVKQPRQTLITNNDEESLGDKTKEIETGPNITNLQELGFGKEKLLVCCNIVRKRLKEQDDQLDKKLGIRVDRITAGELILEERSFLLRTPKNLTQAYLKYIHKEDWYCKAMAKFPQFKKNKELDTKAQHMKMCEEIAERCQDLLEKLKEKYMQTEMNGTDNLWIVKPGGLSRGRKIRIFKDFHKILEYAEVNHTQQLNAAQGLASSSTNPSGQGQQYYVNPSKQQGDDVNVYTKKTWVIQKYIENPMLIMNRKFDIRMWVVVSCWNPLKIYVFKECYLRFSCNDYDPKNPSNLFSHLTNNSVAKKAVEGANNAKMLNKIPGNMWSLSQFKEYLGGKPLEKKPKKSKEKLVPDEQQNTEQNTPILEDAENEQQDEDDTNYEQIGEEVWDSKWYPQAKEIVIQSILSAWDKIEWRKGGVGIYGFDLFPDEHGKLWLLEINKCPTMEYSTAVTKKLVPRFLEDLVELIIDKRKGDHPVVAGFERIYKIPKLRDLTEFQQTQKDLHIEGKGIDGINNQNYIQALHRNKRKNNAPGKNGKYSHNF